MNLYIISSPYHLLLTLIIKKNNDKNNCLLIDEQNNLEKYLKICNFFFDNYWYINFPNGRIDKYRKFNLFASQIFGKCNKLIKELKKKEINNIYIFNDHFFGAQVIVNNLPYKNIYYIEDGSIAYNGWAYKKNIFRKYFYKILFYRYAKQISIPGNTFNYKKKFFLFPEYVRDELQDKRNHSIKYNSKKVKEIFDILTEYFYQEVNRKFDGDNYNLFLLSRLAENGKDNVLESDGWIEKIIEDKKIKINSILLKEHPLSFKKYNNCIFSNYIDREFPIELIPSFIKVKSVFGPPSTSLYTIKYFFPQIDVSCIVKNVNLRKTSFVSMLENCDINIIEHY